MLNKICENKIEIRLAEMNDLKQILMILDKAAIWLYEIGIMNQWMPGEVFKYDEYYENSIERKHWYVALNKNKIVGTFLIRWSDKDIWDEKDDNSGYIHHLAIDRECSITALGEKLLMWAENKIKTNGKNNIRLDCMASNKKLNNYYISRGYEFIKQYEYDDGEIGNLYEKSITLCSDN